MTTASGVRRWAARDRIAPALRAAHCGRLADLLFSAGLSGSETDVNSFNRLIDCMKVGDPITRLCGYRLGVRFAAFSRLHRPG